MSKISSGKYKSLLPFINKLHSLQQRNKLDIAADFNQLKSWSVQKHVVKFLEADLQFSPFVLVGDISAIVKLVNLFLQQ